MPEFFFFFSFSAFPTSAPFHSFSLLRLSFFSISSNTIKPLQAASATPTVPGRRSGPGPRSWLWRGSSSSPGSGASTPRVLRRREGAAATRRGEGGRRARRRLTETNGAGGFFLSFFFLLSEMPLSSGVTTPTFLLPLLTTRLPSSLFLDNHIKHNAQHQKREKERERERKRASILNPPSSPPQLRFSLIFPFRPTPAAS